MQLLTIEELSKLIHKSVASIRSDVVRSPRKLPPIVKLPGNRRVLFRDVQQWIDNHSSDLPHTQPAEAQPAPVRRGPGRPTRAEQQARQMAAGGAA